MSHALIRKLNPSVQTLVIDNASPVDPKPYAEPEMWFRTPDALGHFFHDATRDPPPRDGPGRGHALGWSIAMAMDFQRGVYIEADSLFRLPVSWGFDQMTSNVACQPRCKYYAKDWHVWWVRDLKWFREFDFIRRYDWPNRKGEPLEEAGEIIYANIFGSHAQPLPIRGERGDAIGLNVSNVGQLYPDGIDIATHVGTEFYHHVLRAWGHADISEKFTP